MKATLTMTATDLARALRRLAEARVAERVLAAEAGDADGLAGGWMEAPVGPRHDDGDRKVRRRKPADAVTAGRKSGR